MKDSRIITNTRRRKIDKKRIGINKLFPRRKEKQLKPEAMTSLTKPRIPPRIPDFLGMECV